MTYVDAAFYNDVYEGTPVADEAHFAKLARRASRQVDQLTNFEIAMTGIDAWPPVIAERIRLATAAQVEFLAAVGITTSNFSKPQPQSVGIGKFNVTPGAAGQGLNGSPYSSGMIEHLSSSGLFNAGVSVRD